MNDNIVDNIVVEHDKLRGIVSVLNIFIPSS